METQCLITFAAASLNLRYKLYFYISCLLISFHYLNFTSSLHNTVLCLWHLNCGDVIQNNDCGNENAVIMPDCNQVHSICKCYLSK